jgi:hypothetical protein
MREKGFFDADEPNEASSPAKETAVPAIRLSDG